MTFEQKVEKLRGIVDTGIKIWCQTTDDDLEFIKVANEVYREKVYSEYSIQAGATYKVIYSKDNDGEIDVNYVGNENSIIGLDNYIPYSEFFAEDKVEDKPLESKSIKNYTIGEIESLCLKCDDCSTCVMYIKDHYCDCIFSVVAGLNPQDWKIDEYFNTTPYLNQSEIDILKAIKVLYPNFDKLMYNCDTDMFTGENDDDVNILRSRLSSLKVDKYNYSYSINELLKTVN